MGFVANLFKSYPKGSNPTLSGPGLPRVATSALLLLAGFLLWRELEPNLRFLPTDGVVLGSEVSTVTTYVSRVRTDYVPEVDYRYQVKGQSYFGTQYRRTTLLSRLSAETIASRLVRGTRVQVWYNPSNPADAVLSRSPNPVMFVGFVLSGIMACWMWWKYSRPRALAA